MLSGCDSHSRNLLMSFIFIKVEIVEYNSHSRNITITTSIRYQIVATKQIALDFIDEY